MRPALDAAPSGHKHIKLKYGPYSASRLIVARCPARFHSKYILRDTIVADTLASARGSAIHEVLQRISEAHASRTAIAGTQVNRWVEEAVGKFPASYEQIKLIKDAASAYVGNPSPYLNETTRCEKTLAVSLYEEETFVEDSVPSFAYVKIPVTEGINPWGRELGSGIYFTAKLDQVSFDRDNRIVTILDHKSTPSANQNSDHVFQMGCYAFLAALHSPGYHVRTVIHYAHPRLNFFAPPVYWGDEDLAEVEEEIRMRIHAIESFREYPALPGGHCDYCHMVQLCPENRKIQEQNARGEINLSINSMDDRIRLAKQLRVTGVLYDQINRKLKEDIENNCPDSGVALEGLWYGFKPGEEKVDWVATDRKIRESAPEGLGELLKKHGVEPDTFKEWKGDKLKALFKLNKPELIEELREHLVKDRDTRFGAHKI
jgi:PD-(D/E)XK nuclease superfamily protein